MRFKKYITERIQNPPRDFSKYIQIKLKKADPLVKKINNMQKVIKKYVNDDDIRDFSSSATSTFISPDDFEYLINKYSEFFHGRMGFGLLANLGDLLKEIKREDSREDTLKSILNLIHQEVSNDYSYGEIQFENWLNDYKQWKDRIDRTYKDWIEYENKKKFTEYYNLFKDTFNLIEDIRKWYIDLKVKIIEFKKWLWHDYKPEHEKIETLYHATMYAKEILRDGFQKNMPKERMGLGGAVKGVSFTSDLKIAQDIARYLKEVILIYKGKLKYHHIVDWMRREGIDPKKWPNKEEPETVFDLARFYEYYLWMSKIRTVPVSGSWDIKKSLRAFSNRKESDVGILKCQVDMTNPEIEYMKGEREFRVPPEAVKGCKRL